MDYQGVAIPRGGSTPWTPVESKSKVMSKSKMSYTQCIVVHAIHSKISPARRVHGVLILHVRAATEICAHPYLEHSRLCMCRLASVLYIPSWAARVNWNHNYKLHVGTRSHAEYFIGFIVLLQIVSAQDL